MLGVFDSGVGGLSVLRHVRHLMPGADVVYVADQGRAPYGPRSLAEVAGISVEVTSRLIEMGATTIVVACNTASAAALHDLRARFPDTPFVGMEPAVKPAAISTRSGVIGVLATTATFQGRLYETVVRRFANDMHVLAAECPDWVEMVEEGQVEGPAVQRAVERRITPLLEGHADTLVLGCTHFPFLEPIIGRLAGPSVTVIDPGPAVARQAARLHEGTGTGILTLMSSGDPDRLAVLARALAGVESSRPPLPFPADAHS